MCAEFLALVTSFSTAVSSVRATKGMRDSDADSEPGADGRSYGVLTALLIRDIPPLIMGVLMWFALSGVCASFTGRLLTLQCALRVIAFSYSSS